VRLRGVDGKALRDVATSSRRHTITPPYEDFLGRPSYEVCPNCGFEFGNDDNPGGTATQASFAEYRAEWTARGSPRFWNR
jgi:hypothetical protein